jgi:uncharacterized DUF497 family protein
VKIEFDPAKDAWSIAKHGISLAMAERSELDLLLARENTRERRGEARIVGFAPIGRSVHCVVFVDDEHVYRIISPRKALRKEVRAYASQI